jgi:hypothetical protein
MGSAAIGLNDGDRDGRHQKRRWMIDGGIWPVKAD